MWNQLWPISRSYDSLWVNLQILLFRAKNICLLLKEKQIYIYREIIYLNMTIDKEHFMEATSLYSQVSW